MMPADVTVLTMRQAVNAGLIPTVREGYCVSCGAMPRDRDHLMCHECRVAAEITEQPRLFEEVSR